MQRDMDFVRELLLRVEQLTETNMADLEQTGDGEAQRRKLQYHLKMLIEEAGLLRGKDAKTWDGENWLDVNLTWSGHEYLDSVRDPEIWLQVKAGAEKVGGFSFEVFGALAKGLVK